jgi:hypothetical protein
MDAASASFTTLKNLFFKYERASYHPLGHRGKLPREGGGTIEFSKAHSLVHNRFRRQILPLFQAS